MNCLLTFSKLQSLSESCLSCHKRDQFLVSTQEDKPWLQEFDSLHFHKDYLDYAEFVLFHEYIHCLGNFTHNKEFRMTENFWPNKKEMNIIGKRLTTDVERGDPVSWDHFNENY